jgi:hypothetical protein
MEGDEVGQNHRQSKCIEFEKIHPHVLFATVATNEKAHQQICIKSFSLAFGTSAGTSFEFIHEDLGAIKESACWVPKVLTWDHMALKGRLYRTRL